MPSVTIVAWWVFGFILLDSSTAMYSSCKISKGGELVSGDCSSLLAIADFIHAYVVNLLKK